MKQYLINILIGIDQLFNTLFRGFPDETLSARCWRERKRQPFKSIRPVLDGFFFVFFRQSAHCEQSYLSELRRYQSPAEERA